MFFRELYKTVDTIYKTVQELSGFVLISLKLEMKMSAALDKLRQEVAEMKTVVESSIALLNGLGQQIRDLKGDEAALEQLANDLDAASASLGAAVVANTPAAPTEPTS